METEDSSGYDLYSLYVQTDEEGWTQVFEEYQSNTTWEKEEYYLEDHVDIPNARGLRILFSFDTVDQFDNGYEGWYIDDIGITGIKTVVEKHSNDWSSYVPGRPSHFNNLERLNESMGFWIHMTSNDTLTIVGTKPTVTDITLQPGWNMVGYPCNTSNIANSTLPPEVSKVGYFYDRAPYYLLYEEDLSSISLNSGEGYWIYNGAEGSVIWTVEY